MLGDGESSSDIALARHAPLDGRCASCRRETVFVPDARYTAEDVKLIATVVEADLDYPRSSASVLYLLIR
jgi:hypothetical protein